MSGWNEWAARVDDAIGLGPALLLLLAAAGITGSLLYFYPNWLPRHRRARQKSTVERTPAEPVSTVEADELPDLPVEEFRSLADRLAEQGRYAEAVRERLRAIVRELIDAGLIENRPGWTVTELAAAAGRARPPVRPPLDAAAGIFSDIWYGQRPAGRRHDERMRGHAEAVHAALSASPAGSPR